MKSSIVINKQEKNYKEYLIKKNPEEIFKQILGINDNIKIIKNSNSYLLYHNDKLLCSFRIDYTEELYDYIIEVNYKEGSYRYYCDENGEILKLNLIDYCFYEDGKSFYITNYGYGVSAEITKNNEKISIEIEDNKINTKMFERIIRTLEFEESLEIIYNKLLMLSLNQNIKIKKSIVQNTCDYKEKTTDLLIIRDGELRDFLTTINKNKVNYILKKDSNSYTVTLINDSIEILSASYFAVNEQVDFIKRLETKGKTLKRIKKEQH